MKQLRVTKQCSKCPWKASANPKEIPNGYCRNKHKNLSKTISTGIASLSNNHAMACHETHDAYCVGWLINQLGPGNNIGLRLRMRNYDLRKVEVFGEQHRCFEDTLKLKERDQDE